MTSPLIVKAAREGQTIARVTPESAGWRRVGFEALRLAPGETYAGTTGARELCIVVVAGKVAVTSGEIAWRDLGTRETPFEDVAPHAVYLPPGRDFTIVAATATRRGRAVLRAGGEGRRAAADRARVDAPDGARQGSNTRYVRDILPQDAPAESLLVVEVITPPGHSSSYPPHKHDTEAIPAESSLEETYYHRLDPPQGFVFQRVYTDDRSLDEAMAVEDRDVVLVPRGYHRWSFRTATLRIIST